MDNPVTLAVLSAVILVVLFALSRLLCLVADWFDRNGA